MSKQATHATEPPRRETILTGSAHDQATHRDALGFAPYVRALAEFLTSANTRPPLTISVEGAWGSGKSSFMLQLREALRARRVFPTGTGRFRRHEAGLTVWFNAWRHDAAEALWAAFAIRFVRQIAEQLPVHRRWLGHARLFVRRFRWRAGWPDLARAAALTVVLVAAAVALPIVVWFEGPGVIATLMGTLSLDDGGTKTALEWMARGGGTLGTLALMFTAWIKLKHAVGNPLEVDLRQYIASPDYQGRLSFIERFHADFAKVVGAYAGNRTVFVFIDDLDRCDVPRAAELMTALNLLVSADPRLVFIMGMDREKVAAGLAVKHEKLLPYLEPSTASAGSTAGADAAGRLPYRGIEYGYSFIEKFIQIPFLLPQPGPERLKGFLAGLGDPERAAHAAATRPPGQRRPPFWRRWWGDTPDSLAGSGSVPGSDDPTNTNMNNAASDAAGGFVGQGSRGPYDRTQPPGLDDGGDSQGATALREGLKLEAAGDSDTVRDIVLAVAGSLNHNPRRLKQFLNLFRLRSFIAAETGLFDEVPGTAPGLTLQQLGKFVALGLEWPLLLANIADEPTLLADLQEAALGQNPKLETASYNRWATRRDVYDFLRIGCLDDLGGTSRSGKAAWGLGTVDVTKLSAVSPGVRVVQQAASDPPPPPPGQNARSTPREDTNIAEPPVRKHPDVPPAPEVTNIDGPSETNSAEQENQAGSDGSEVTAVSNVTEANDTYDVYISQAQPSPWAREVLPLLEQRLETVLGRPARVFEDPDLVPFAQEWPAYRLEALGATRVMLAILTPQYFESQSCQAEWSFMEQRTQAAPETGRGQTRILPLVLAGLERMPTTVQKLYWFDMTRWSDVPRAQDRDEFEKILDDLAKQLAAAINALAPPTAP
jgi:hypothetical protein